MDSVNKKSIPSGAIHRGSSPCTWQWDSPLDGALIREGAGWGLNVLPGGVGGLRGLLVWPPWAVHGGRVLELAASCGGGGARGPIALGAVHVFAHAGLKLLVLQARDQSLVLITKLSPHQCGFSNHHDILQDMAFSPEAAAMRERERER